MSNLFQMEAQDIHLSKLQQDDLKSEQHVAQDLTERNHRVKMNEYIQVVTTVNDEKKAGEIARLLLRKRVVACVQIIGPISSFCWWKGKMVEANEWMCLAKGMAEDYEEIQTTIKSTHPYEVPEILAVPVYSGNPAYLSWIREETAPKP